MYDVHYWPTPNGKKVTILLEELGTQYKVYPVILDAATSSVQNSSR
jgi:glutathione S-transferase